jgi:Protein of unknown function (DUF1559)
MLLPALAKPKETARRAVCKSNLHQLGLAATMYARDNHDNYPPVDTHLWIRFTDTILHSK